MNIVLNRLDRAETGKYIAAHMAYAGVKQDLFTSGAEDEIFKVSADTTDDQQNLRENTDVRISTAETADR